MSAIITEKFRQHNANQFIESFTEASASTYYLFLGKATAFTNSTTGGSDSSPPTPADSVKDEAFAWDSMLGAKLISSNDIKNAIPRRNWANGTIYDMYEHDISASNTTTSGASNIFDSTFYFITSEYRVYKVLDNNGGTAYSGSEPTSESNSPFALGGYILKYMYKITASDFAKYGTSDFVPVTTDSTVSTAAVGGGIESLIVTGGSGYTDGTYYAAVYGDGTSQGTSSGSVIRITISGGVIADFGLSAGTDTTVNSIGAGYTFGYVNLGSAFTFSDTALTTASSIGSGSGGAIKVIISPTDGHGNNAVTELGGHYVMAAVTLTQAEGDDFTTANDFRSVGLVVNPTNYGKVIEYDSTLSLLYYQQESFKGFGTNSTNGGYVAFSGTNTITGATSGATGTTAAATETLTLAGNETLSLTAGYANPELQPDTGNIIYLENRKPIQRASDQTEDIKIIIEF